MALRIGRQCLPVLARRERLTLGCALAVGMATIKFSSHCGDIRTRWPHQLNPVLRPFSTYLPQNQLFSSLSPSNENTMTSATPPQAPWQWNHSAEDITRLTKNAIEECRKAMDSVASLDPKDCTFESVSLCPILVTQKLTFITGVCE